MKKAALTTLVLSCTLAIAMTGCASAQSANNEAAASSQEAARQVTTVVGTMCDSATGQSTDDGVTGKSFEDLQSVMDSKIEIGMTLTQVREVMGADGTLLSGDAFLPDSYAFYTADRQACIVASFDGAGGAAKLVACEISLPG